MDCLRVTTFCYIDNSLDLQVALRGGRRTDEIGFVSFSNVQCITVGFGVNSYCAYAHFTACCHDAYRYFTTVGDEYF